MMILLNGWLIFVGYMTSAGAYLLFAALFVLPGAIPIYLGYRLIKRLLRRIDQ